MKSRERILTALKHRVTDRIPVDLGSTESSGITWKAYHNLINHLKLKKDILVFDLLQLVCKVDIKILEYIGADAVPLLFEPVSWKDWQFEKGLRVKIPGRANLERVSGDGTFLLDPTNKVVIAKMPRKGYYFDTVHHPLQHATSINEIDQAITLFDSYDRPYYCDEDNKTFQTRAKELHQQTDYAVVGNLWVHLLAAGQDLRGFEQFMIDLVQNRTIARKILQNQVDAYLPRIDEYINSVGKYIDVIQVNDDLGTQNSPQMSRELYREMLKPYHKKLWSYIKERSGKPILLHSCGSIYDLIPDLIEIGVDALNPVQVSARNMDTRKLKREFGRYITFWGGGCDTQKILPYGTPEDVRSEVRRRAEELGEDGGFVFCQVHNIQHDVPPENILAMYEELKAIDGI
jgi:uroporphyrinogen decarboxylase